VPRMKLFALALAICLGATCPGFAGPADAYPTRPVRVLVGFSPGGAVDVIARALGEQLSEQLGQPFVIESKPGAGSNLAAVETARSTPDGYTLILGTTGLAVNMTLFPKPGFDVDDLSPISKIGEIAAVIAANPSFPANTIPDLVAAARAKPGALSYGSPGNGSSPHLAMELFQRVANIQLTHVAYKGGTPAITDALGGHIPLVAVNVLEALRHIQAGSLKALGVTSAQRLAMLPNAMTIAESGYPGYSSATWYALFGPGKMPPDIVTKLNDAVRKALADPRFRAKVEQVGGEVTGSSPNDLRAFVRAERAKWGQVVRDAQIKVD
jgi:tripartite-type tricarboxylate transporter receptor subunit TctC